MVNGAPAHTQATLRIGSLSPVFDPTLGAEVVSMFPETFLNFTTDSMGRLNTEIYTGGLSDARYYQFVFVDPDAPTGFSVSNAVRMEFFDTRMFAVRDQRYKLIHFSSCHRELYDLWSDPFENNDLLTLQADTDAVTKAHQLYRTALGSRSRGF